MPRIDIATVPMKRGSDYPAPFAELVEGRSWRSLGAAAGLTQFGVNLVRIAPGSASSQRHWHENEDEFLLVLEGELVLIEDGGETVLRVGDVAGFKAGVPNGHHLVSRSSRDAVLLVVGTRAPTDRTHYPDIDLAFEKSAAGRRFTTKAGESLA
jgi:uncharacterized cupin superfamily protein